MKNLREISIKRGEINDGFENDKCDCKWFGDENLWIFDSILTSDLVALNS